MKHVVPLLRGRLFPRCPGGEIGRRARFRCESRKVWGFESLPGHERNVVRRSFFYFSSMFTVYILQSISYHKFYTGFTEDIERRLSEHNAGKSKFTSAFRPWRVGYTEKVKTRDEARKLEKYYKSAAGKRRLRHLLGGGSLPD